MTMTVPTSESGSSRRTRSERMAAWSIVVGTLTQDRTRRREAERPVSSVHLAVNGTLMRGLGLNANLLDAGATFVREARTAPAYRLWSIDDRHPAMVRVSSGGAAVAVEVWDVPFAGLTGILLKEPPGLAIGKVTLDDGEEVLGV